MERDILIEKINSVKDASKDRNIIYEVLMELGISFKKTNCKKCLKDLLNIAKEELGLVGNAADFSDFNDEEFDYVYVCDRPQSWHGYIINQDTPVEIIREFVKKFPKGYYIKQYTMINIPNFLPETNLVQDVYSETTGLVTPVGVEPEQVNNDNENNDQENNDQEINQ